MSRLRTKSGDPTEYAIQRAIVDLLKLLKFEVLTTSVRRFNLKDGKGYGTTPGIPDLLVRAPRWPEGIWLGLEVKRARGGRLSPAQRRVWQAGGIVVVTGPQEARVAVEKASRCFDEA